jgi:hypothetical protein
VSFRANPYIGRFSGKDNERPKGDRGSILPLGIGLFLISIAIYMLSADIYSMRSAKLRLERIGETLLTNAYQNLAYDQYFLESGTLIQEDNRSFLPFDCAELIQEMENLLAKINGNSDTGSISTQKVDSSNTRLDSRIRAVSLNCSSSKLRLVLADQVKLPFTPPVFADFKPIVMATISGGLQRVRSR